MKLSLPAALAFAVLLPSATAGAADPIGALEAADCVGVRGWAQDPDQPLVAMDVHIYFNGPPGDPLAAAVPVNASVERDDLCRMLGSCEHGFDIELPLGVRDGAPHNVWVYGIDLEAVNNPLLGGPLEVMCPAPPIVGGVRRWVSSPEILTAWQFSTFVDLLHLDDLGLAAVPESDPWPAAPMLVTSDAGDGVLWLIDGTFRREIAEDAIAAWRFVPANAAPMAEAQLDAMPIGPDVRVRPFLVQGTMPAVYVLDEVPCDPAGCPPEDDETGGAVDSGDETAATDPATTGSEDAGGDPSGDPPQTDTGTDATTAPGIDPGANGHPEPSSGCGCTQAPAHNGLWSLCVLALRRRARQGAQTSSCSTDICTSATSGS